MCVYMLHIYMCMCIYVYKYMCLYINICIESFTHIYTSIHTAINQILFYKNIIFTAHWGIFCYCFYFARNYYVNFNLFPSFISRTD